MTVRRIGQWLALLTWVTALALTLYPYRFDLDVASLSRIDWRLTYARHNDRDLVINLLMLIPLGAGWAMARLGRASTVRIAVEAGAIGVGTALLIETLQIFERVRYPQIADVWRNGVGCLVGAAVVAFVLGRWRSTNKSFA
jgi:VanZ family protein